MSESNEAGGSGNSGDSETRADGDAPGYIDDKDALLRRLRRIRGQVGGVERMVESERYCIDILTQIGAIRAALDGVAIGLLDDHARHCVIGASSADREVRTTEMVDAITRLLRAR